VNWTGRLTTADLTLADTVAHRYVANALAVGARDWHYRGDPLHLSILREGIQAEIFVARVYGVGWTPQPLDGRRMPDVANVDVRHTWRPHGSLLLHKPPGKEPGGQGDPPERPHVLVTGVDTMTIRGWCWTGEGQHDTFWRRDLPGPCYLIAQRYLERPDTLPIDGRTNW
jgi:hypothetical protein